jgi:uncharacterized protein (TIRG00374 family)
VRRLLRPALVVAGFIVSAVLTYLAARNVDLDVFWTALRQSNAWWLLPALAVLALTVLVRALRWRIVFPPRTRPPLPATTRALLVGYLFNNILPLRAGEALRVVVLHEEAGTSRAEALATAVSERVYDVLALLVLLLVASPFLPDVTWLRRAAVLTIVLLVLIVVAFTVLLLYGERPVRFLLRPAARLPGLSEQRVDYAAASIVRGFSALRRPGIAVPAFAVTVASWLALAVSFWLAMQGFDLGVGFGAALLVVVSINLAMVIPSSPAAVGVFEAATLVALRAYGIEDSLALAYAVVLHALNFFPFVVVGFAVLYRHAALRRKTRLVT